MPKIIKNLVILSFSIIVFWGNSLIGHANQLNWIDMDTTENIKNSEPIIKKEDREVINQVAITPDNAKLKDISSTSTIITTIEEIKKRRREDDILLANLLTKQKEQEQEQKEREQQQKEFERKKIVDDVIAVQQKKQKEDESNLANVLRNINEQQAKLQADRDQQQAEQNKSLLELLQIFKTQQENQQQRFVSNSSVNIIPLDDPQYAKKSIQQYISENTQDAKEAPSREADISFFYSSGSLFKIYCKEGFLTDIQLQPGEEIQYIGGGDTVRWIIDKAQSGTGNQRSWHIYIKPAQSGLETNLVINTDKHSYQVQVQSTNWYNPIVRWSYPQEEKSAFFRQQTKEKKLEDESITMSRNSPDNLNFSYSIKGKSYTWSPTVAFDDGTKTYIKMPVTLVTGDAPILYIKDKNKLKLVNYRIKNSYYIVDRIFKEAELRVGTDAVQIKQN